MGVRNRYRCTEELISKGDKFGYQYMYKGIQIAILTGIKNG